MVKERGLGHDGVSRLAAGGVDRRSRALTAAKYDWIACIIIARCFNTCAGLFRRQFAKCRMMKSRELMQQLHVENIARFSYRSRTSA